MSGMVELTMLVDIAMRLARLREGLENGNSAAEEAACNLAAEAAELLAKAEVLQ